MAQAPLQREDAPPRPKRKPDNQDAPKEAVNVVLLSDAKAASESSAMAPAHAPLAVKLLGEAK